MNQLSDPLYLAATDDGTRRMTLPEVLAGLARGERLEFPGVRPYQVQAWHSFLVQVAVFALDRAGQETPWPAEDTWGDALRELGGGDEAWTLVVADLSKPGFMQPPVPEGSLAALKDGPLAAPDDTGLDLLYTGRRHDLKPDRIVDPTDEAWALALITLQTMSGFGGRSNYGVVRMNGAYSSRPMLSIAGPWAERFRRDIRAWQRALDDRRELYGGTAGEALVWTIPWEGTAPLATDRLHPAFIEVCRRIRLERRDGRVRAWRVGTASPRIHAKELNGATGDAWTPISLNKGTSLTVKGGFSYRLVHDLLFSGEWKLPRSVADIDAEPQTLELRALEGGQGGTAGLHVRSIRFPARAMRMFRDDEAERQRLGKRSANQIQLAKDVGSRVLRPVVATLLQGAPEKLDLTDDRIKPTLARFEARVDDGFFAQLFGDLEASSEAHLRAYSRHLRELAEGTYALALGGLPIPDGRRERAIASADGLFFGGLKKQLPAAYPEPSDEAEETNAA